MCMPVILPKYFPNKGAVIGVSMMNAYMNAMLNAQQVNQLGEKVILVHAITVLLSY